VSIRGADGYYSHTVRSLLRRAPIETANHVIRPENGLVAVCAFQQLKKKKAPFDIVIRLAGETFTFRFKE
jgi:hypothetical protein